MKAIITTQKPQSRRSTKPILRIDLVCEMNPYTPSNIFTVENFAQYPSLPDS